MAALDKLARAQGRRARDVRPERRRARAHRGGPQTQRVVHASRPPRPRRHSHEHSTNIDVRRAADATAQSIRRAQHALRRELGALLIPLAVAGAPARGCGSSLAPLSGAIVATGKLKVELNRKTVQHQEGGIVREILVRDGEHVARRPAADRDRRRAQRCRAEPAAGSARRGARSQCARDGGSRARSARSQRPPTGESSRRTPSTSRARRALFAARRRTLDEQIASLEAQIRDAHAQAARSTQQIESTETAAKLVAEERAINEKLVRDGFVQRARILQLQRARSRLSRAGSSESQQRSRARAPARRRAPSAHRAGAQSAISSRRPTRSNESAARIREIEEATAAAPRSSRAPIRARARRRPRHGAARVRGRRVIGPREPILDIVPTEEKLVVEAHIRPQDINYVHEGAPAEVRLTRVRFAHHTAACRARSCSYRPIASRRARAATSWYVANVESSRRRSWTSPEIRLQAGMPAELFVTTPARTLFEYLTKPLTAFTSRAMREP